MAFSTLVLRSFLESAERLKIKRDCILDPALTRTLEQPGRAWLDNVRFYELLDRAICSSDDAALGLRIGERHHFTAFGATGLLMKVVPTFREAVSAMARFHQVARDEPDIAVNGDARELVVEYRLFDAAGSARQCLAEIVLGSLSVLLRQFGGVDGAPSRVEFAYPAPPHAAEYERLFGCDVLFDRPRVALVVSRELAAHRQLLSDPELARVLQARAEADRADGEQPHTLSGHIRAHLRQAWRSSTPNMDSVARALGMSQRSLHRHLARQGVDYRTILNETRCEVAAGLLSQKNLSVKQVAHELGFSGSSAFYRAFKRWMGCSPSDFASSAQPSGSRAESQLPWSPERSCTGT